VAAAVPVRRAVRADAAAELSGRGRRAEAAAPATRRRVAALGAVALGGLALVWLGNRGGGLESWQVPAGGLGFAVLAIFTILVGANVAAPVIRPLGRLVRGRAAEQLAVANLTRDPRRTGVMVAAVGAAVTTAFVTAGYGNGVRAAIEEDVVRNLDGVSVAAVGAGANANLEVGVPQDVIDGLDALPESGRLHQGATVLAGARAEDLVSVVAFQDLWFEDGEEALRGTYDLSAFASGQAVVNATVARDRGLRPGDDVTLPTPGGPVDVPVMAVASGGGASGRTVQIPWELHRRLYGPVPPRSVDVEPAAGVTPAELDAAITAAGLDAEVTVRAPADVVRQAARSADAQLAPFRTLQQGLLAVSFVAVLSTLLLVGVQRQREFGVLGALGMEPPSLARMVLAEGAAVAVGAIVLGVAGGVLVLYAIVLVAPLLIGFATPFTPDWPPYATASAIALAVTLAASAWPAHRASRTDPLQSLRDE
jgi:putative ABC transport system permease protein